MLEFVLLGMVLDEGLTGYDIKKKIESGIGVFYKASYGSLYPSLKKLSEKGLLSVQEAPQGDRKKIFYRATEEGIRCFFAWLSTPTDISEGAAPHLAKVYFFDLLSPEAREQQLALYEANNRSYLDKLYALEKKFRGLEDPSCFYYKLSTLYYGISITEKTIRWCRHIREQRPLRELTEGENTWMK